LAHMARRILGGHWVVATSVASVLLAISPAHAQTPSPAAKADPSPFAPGDLKRPIFDTHTPVFNVGDAKAKSLKTVVAEVDGRAITLGSVSDAIATLSPADQRLPYDELFPRIQEQLVRQQALVIQAQREGLDEDLTIKRQIQAAADRILANAYLRHAVTESISEADLLARYDRDYAGKPGPVEVHLRLIMVPTEQAAAAVIGELKAGGDFATLARRSSVDATSGSGGDLGWIIREDVNSETAAVAFSLQPGQFTPFPVLTAGAWFVMKVEDRRMRPTPAFSAVHDTIQAELARERVPQVAARALSSVTVRTYDIAGKEDASSGQQ
jgi:peptidyl-prolyl cis-trans isomerase C